MEKHQINSMTTQQSKDIVTKAEHLANRYSVPPIPVLEIAEREGIDVVLVDIDQHEKTVAGFVDFAGSRMFINNALSNEQKAETMAHELGHWLLHKEVFAAEPEKYAIMPRFTRPDLTSQYEIEANKFAAHLLIPSNLLEPVRKQPPAMLAKLFLVSTDLIEERLKSD